MNFNYFLSDAVADYIVEAVRLVARDGWRLLGDYRFDTATGVWTHRDGVVEPPLRLGGDHVRRPGDARPDLAARRRRVAARAAPRRTARRSSPMRREPDLTPPHSLSADFEHLRWFDLPASAVRADAGRRRT